MDYMGRVICGSGTQGTTPTPVNPFDQLLNTTNDVEFKSMFVPTIHVGDPLLSPFPLYTLPEIGPPAGPFSVIKYIGDSEKNTVWEPLFDQVLNEGDDVKFNAMEVTGTLTTATLKVASGLTIDSGVVGTDYTLPSSSAGGSGAFLVSTAGSPATEWTATPAYTTIYYTHPLGAADSAVNSWGVWTGQNMLPLSVVPPSAPTLPFSTGATRDFDLSHGIEMFGPSGMFEATVCLSLVADPSIPAQTDVEFALNIWDGTTVTNPSGTHTDRILMTRLGNSSFEATNTNLSFTTTMWLSTNDRLWLGLNCSNNPPDVGLNMEFWVRSLIIRLRRVVY